MFDMVIYLGLPVLAAWILAFLLLKATIRSPVTALKWISPVLAGAACFLAVNVGYVLMSKTYSGAGSPALGALQLIFIIPIAQLSALAFLFGGFVFLLVSKTWLQVTLWFVAAAPVAYFMFGGLVKSQLRENAEAKQQEAAEQQEQNQNLKYAESDDLAIEQKNPNACRWRPLPQMYKCVSKVALRHGSPELCKTGGEIDFEAACIGNFPKSPEHLRFCRTPRALDTLVMARCYLVPHPSPQPMNIMTQDWNLTPLMVFAKFGVSYSALNSAEDVVAEMLSAGINVNAKDKFGANALHHSESAAVTLALLNPKFGLDAPVLNTNGRTALAMQLRRGFIAEVTPATMDLMKTRGLNIRNIAKDGSTHLHDLFLQPYDTIWARYKEATPVHLATAMNYLLAQGLSLDTKNSAGFTPEDLARKNGFPELKPLIRK